MDERSQSIVARAMAITLAMTYIYVLVEFIWKLAAARSISDLTWETGLLFLIPCGVALFSRNDFANSLPRTFVGKELPSGVDKKSKGIRKKHYAIIAIVSSFLLTVISVAKDSVLDDEFILTTYFPEVGYMGNYIIGVASRLIAIGIVFYLFEFVYGEHKIKKYIKYLDDLEDE